MLVSWRTHRYCAVVVALALLASVLAAVSPSPVAAETDRFSDGTELAVEITSPASGAEAPGGRTTLTGVARVGGGETVADTAAVIVWDVSGSTSDPASDCNGDGRTDSILTCERAAIAQYLAAAADIGSVAEVALISFQASAAIRDMRPDVPGLQVFAHPRTDSDNDGITDAREALNASPGAGGGTNYERAIRAACSALSGSSQPNRYVVFLSDGRSASGASVATVLPCASPAPFRTFAVGRGIDCNTGGNQSLARVASLSGGSCRTVTDPAVLRDLLEALARPELVALTLTVNSDPPIDLGAHVTPPLPVPGPQEATFAYEVTGLEGPTDELCVTVTGRRDAEELSTTDCVTVVSNAPPVADAGGDRTVEEGSAVVVDGSSSSDPDGDPLSYAWRLVRSDGPPLVLSSTSDPQVSFEAPDDGEYTFELTVSDGVATDTDEATITVANSRPTATARLDDPTAGGVALLTITFTDPGYLDTHRVDVDWGDGTAVETFPVAAQGTGWGSVAASHVYAHRGPVTATATVTDDDGGASASAAEGVDIALPMAIWATGSAPDTLWILGNNVVVDGRTHAENELRISGSDNRLTGDVTYVRRFVQSGGRLVVDPPARQTATTPPPVVLSVEQFAPGGPVASSVGSAYHDMSGQCRGGRWQPTDSLAPGVYWAPCHVVVTGSQFSAGAVTIATAGRLQVSGAEADFFEPFYGGALFVVGATGDGAARVTGWGSTFVGFVSVPGGEVEISGFQHRFRCGVVGRSVVVSGSANVFDAAACAEPERTAAPPLLVPRIEVTYRQEPSSVAPGGALDVASSVANDGATIVVPSVTGLENLGDTPITVGSASVRLERRDVATGTWETVPANVGFRANAAPGVVAGPGDAPAGTVVQPDALATWSVELVADLDAATVLALLDPSVTGGLRTVADFDVPDGADVRQVYRYGDDLAEALVTAGGDLADVTVTLVTPGGAVRHVDASEQPELATLVPGERVELAADAAVPPAAGRGPAETTAAYLARLAALDGTTLTGAASARATGGVGLVLGAQVAASSVRRVPVVEPTVTGASTGVAGEQLTWAVGLRNSGSALAAPLVVEAAVGGAPAEVTGAPDRLAAAAIEEAALRAVVPADTRPGDIETLATVRWSDGAGNEYGPVEAVATTTIGTAPALVATLADSLAVDADGNGLPSPGDTLAYRATITNRGDGPADGVAFALEPDANTSLVPGSVVTDRGSVGPGVTVAIGTIPGRTSAEVAFRAVIAEPLPGGVRWVQAQGTVSATDLGDTLTDDPGEYGSPNPTRTLVVLPEPALDITLEDRLAVDADGNGQPSVGDTIRYELVMASVGDVPVLEVIATADADPASRLVAGSVTTTQGHVTGGNQAGDTEVRVAVGDLGPLVTAASSFDVVVDGPDALELTVQAKVGAGNLAERRSDDPGTATPADPTVTRLATSGDPSGGTGGDGPGIGAVAPLDGATVTEPTTLTTVLAPRPGTTVAGWSVDVRPAGTHAGGAGELAIATGTGEAVTATVDPTVLANGVWTVRVTARDDSGGTTVAETSLVVDGHYKPGRFTATYVDVDVPVGGLPVQVRRTYDTLRRDVSGDFGHGWSLDVATFRVQTNRPLGAGGWQQFGCGSGLIFVPLCYRTTTPHYVTVTWPDGTTETFDFTPRGLNSFFPVGAVPAYTARPGTASRLEPAPGDDAAGWRGDGNLYAGGFGQGAVYDPQQFVLVSRDGTRYLLDRAKGLLRSTDRSGNTVTVDRSGIVSSTGTSITFTRDALGRITAVDGPGHLDWSYVYDASGDLVTATNPNGVASELSYDGRHLLLESAVAGSPPVQRLLFDDDGRIARVVDGEGNAVDVDFDVDGRTETYVGPDPRLTTVRRLDERGNVESTTEIVGGRARTWRYEYDEFDRRTGSTSPDGARSTAAYAPTGEITRHVDGDGLTTDIAYDAFGLPTTVSVDGAVQERYRYDRSGNVVSVEHADGSALAFAYDAGDRLMSSTDTAGRVTYFEYDAFGFLSSTVDPLGRTVFVNDQAGRTVASTAPDGATARYEYDAVGNLTAVVDPNGGRTAIAYDAFDRVTSTVGPDGAARRFAYDDAGRLASYTDRTGLTTTTTYNAYGQPVVREASDGSRTTYTYDGAGQLLTAANDAATVTFEWDDAGNQTAETVAPAGEPERAVTLRYDVSPGGRRRSVTDPVGTTSLAFDESGVLSSVTDSVVGHFDIATDQMARLERISRPNGVSTTATYGADRLAALHTPGVLSRTFEYDAAGLPASVIDDDGTHTFSYDGLGRISGVDRPEGSGYADESFTYDANGNRTSWRGTPLGSADFDDANRLLRDGTAQYTYDAEGRLTTRTDVATGRVTTFGWDAAGRLTTVEAPGGVHAAFRYDAFGRRVAESVDGTERWVTFDGPEPRLVWDGDGRLVQRLVSAPQFGSVLGATDADGTTLYPVLDEAGTVVAATDESGSLAGRYRYDTFGSPVGSRAPDGLDRWHGLDGSVAGLALSWARAYDASIGRFISEDPLPALNPYSYALNNPLTTSDPTGLSVASEYASTTKQSARSAQALCTQGSLTATFLAEVATDIVFTGAMGAVLPSGPGLYGFIDQSRGGRLYLGRSIDLRERILAHMRDGRPAPGTRGFIIRLSDDIVRNIDVAEQLLINGCGTVGKGGTLANRINAVNAKRRQQLEELQQTLMSLLGG